HSVRRRARPRTEFDDVKILLLRPMVNGLAILLSSLVQETSALAGACPAPTFTAAGTYGTGTNPASVAVGDFNGDGKADLAVANSALSGGTASVSVLLGRGDGTFQAAVNYVAESGSSSVAVGDFNGDLNPDLAGASSALFDDLPSISVLLGKGNGIFQAAVNYDAGTSPRSLAVGDFNGDGQLDLAVANYGSFVNGQFTNSA